MVDSQDEGPRGEAGGIPGEPAGDDAGDDARDDARDEARDETEGRSLADVVDAEPRVWGIRRSVVVAVALPVVLGVAALIAFAPTLLERLGGGRDGQAVSQESLAPDAAAAGTSPAAAETEDPDGAGPRGQGGGGSTPEDKRSAPPTRGADDAAGGGDGTGSGNDDDGAGSGTGDSPGDGGGTADNPPPARTSSVVAISDGRERSWDPCGLIRPSLDALGGARLDTDPEELNRCAVTTGSGTTVEMMLWRGFEDPSGDPSGVGSATLYQGSSEGDDCENQIVPAAGDYRFDVEATGPDACDAADTVAKRAAAIVGDGKVPARSVPAGLGGRSACDLPGDSALRSALTVDDIPGPRAGFAEWDCLWDGDDNRFLRVIFQHADPSSDGERRTAHGHTIYVRGDAWEEGCLVDVVARTYQSPDGDGAVSDLARVHLRGSDDESALCDDAITVANSIAAAL